MIGAHAYLNLTRAVDDLRSSHVYDALSNDQPHRSACTRAPDSGCIVRYDGIIDRMCELALPMLMVIRALLESETS